MNRSIVLISILIGMIIPCGAQYNSLDPKPIIEPGKESIIADDGPGGNHRGTPHVVFGNSEYLCVWKEGWEGKNGGARIKAVRVDMNGKKMDSKPISVSPNKNRDDPQEQPKASFCRNVYLVVWQDLRNKKDYDILAVRISEQGEVLDNDPIVIAGGPHNQVLPDVASDGKGFMVVWQGFVEKDRSFHGYAVRVEMNGNTGTPVETGLSPLQKIAWNGRDFLVTCGGATGSLNRPDDTAAALRLNADGIPVGNIFPVTRLRALFQYSVSALPGKGWLFVHHLSPPDAWGWGGPGRIRGYLIPSDAEVDYQMTRENVNPAFPFDAIQIDASSDDRTSWPYGSSACAWDGRQSIIVWQRFATMGERKTTLVNGDIMATGIDEVNNNAGRPVPIAATSSEELNPSLASDGEGRLLCAYEKWNKGRTSICMRMIISK